MPLFTVTIETPRHSTGKYFYDPKDRCFRLKKLLPLGMSFPYDFGMIQNTVGDDGDPLDAMVITECDTYPGVELPCRLIGVLLATQQSPGKKTIRNDRYFFIPKESIAYDHINNISDFSKKHNRQLLDFFVNYNKVEGKIFIPLRLSDSARAEKQMGKELH
jgi:inorganic pyrophosphatase